MKQTMKYIVLAIKKNTTEKIEVTELKKINDMYKNLTQLLEENMFEISTFEKAACLLLSIISNNITSNKKTNCAIAVDASIEMCKKPTVSTLNEVCELKETNYDSQKEERKLLIDGISQDKSIPTILNLSTYLKNMYYNAINDKNIVKKIYYKTNSTPATE